MSLQSREEARVITFEPHRDVHSTNLPRLCHASLTFKVELSVSSKSKRVERGSGVVSGSGSPVSYVQEVLNFLKKRLHDILQEKGFSDENKNTVEVYIVLMKLALMARLLSALKQLGILATNTVSCCPLMDAMEKQLNSSFEVLAKIDGPGAKLRSSFNRA